MDIQALRARALETKKRKRVRPDTPTAPSLRADDDLEEGEIDDGAPVAETPTYTTATNGHDRVRADQVQRTSSATPTVNEHAAPTPAPARHGASTVPGTGQSSSAARSVCEWRLTPPPLRSRSRPGRVEAGHHRIALVRSTPRLPPLHRRLASYTVYVLSRAQLLHSAAGCV